VAKETGGIVLIKDDMTDVPKALELSKATVRKIKENLLWAFFYNVALIPIAAGVLVPFLGARIYEVLPLLAGLGMAISSVTVVSNSLLLRRFSPKICECLQKDLVCGMIVDEKKTKLVSNYEGKSFYFCSTACKTSFDRDPRRFAHK
jgi:YHS domain-containing protein